MNMAVVAVVAILLLAVGSFVIVKRRKGDSENED